MNLLDVEKNPIPSHLSLDEQGVFVLGYYHQRAALYIQDGQEILPNQPHPKPNNLKKEK